jgi:hypothetical protein
MAPAAAVAEPGRTSEDPTTYKFIRAYVLTISWIAGSYLFFNVERFTEMALSKGHQPFYINFLMYGFAVGFCIVNVMSIKGLINGPEMAMHTPKKEGEKKIKSAADKKAE